MLTSPLTQTSLRHSAAITRSQHSAWNVIAVGCVVLACFGCEQLAGPVEIAGETTLIEPIKNPSTAAGCTDAGAFGAACPTSRCEPDAYHCQAAVLQRCNLEGTGWAPVDQCASEVLCDAALGACLPALCAPRQHRCTETGELVACSADLTRFEHVENCRSPAFCSAASGREGCESAACRAGRQRCNGAQIEECRADRRGFTPVGEPCASASLCVEGESELARCQEPTCEAGRVSCEGVTLQRCADQRNVLVRVDSCATPELCNAGMKRCDPPACEVGQRHCEGNALQLCNAARTGYVTQFECATAAACDENSPACLVLPPVTPPPVVVGTDPYTFVPVTGTGALGLGPMVLEVPAQWTDVDTRPWISAAGETLGPLFIASTDAARFAANFDIPGVYFAATARPPLDVAAMQARFDLSMSCTKAGNPERYSDGIYSGTSQSWVNCGVTKATNVVVAAAPADGRFVTVVIVTLLGERDRDAMERIWGTFVVQ